MTILNFRIFPHRALISMDSRLAHGRLHVDAGKLFYLPGQNLLIGTRGPFHFGLGAFVTTLGMGIDLDALASRWLEIVSEADRIGAVGGHEPASFSTAIIGWSASRGRPSSLVVQRSAGLEESTVRIDEQAMTAPWELEWGDVPEILAPRDFHDLARRQLKMIQPDHAAMGFGGSLVVAELRQHSTTFTRAITACG
jgi:hypothetical protein